MGYIIGEIKDMPSSFSSHEEYHEFLMKEIKNERDVDYNLDILFKDTYRLGYKQLAKYKNLEEDIDLLLPLMSVAFMKTVKNYKVDEGNIFGILYTINIKNEVLKEYYCVDNGERKIKKDYDGYSNTSLDKNNDSDSQVTFYNLLEDTKENVEKQIENKYLIKELKSALDSIFKVKMSSTDKRTKRDRKKKESYEKNKRNKEMFMFYLKMNLNEEKISTDDLAKLYDLEGSNARKIIRKYRKLLKEELVKRGVL